MANEDLVRKDGDSSQKQFTTQILKFDGNDESLEEAVRWLRAGEVVAFPTETVYGLGANALDPNAVARIFEAKGRPSDNPLIVHVSSLDMLRTLIDESDLRSSPDFEMLIREFWPGPLTLLFKKSDRVPESVTAGQPKVAVRMPSHPVARKLIELSGVPLAAPSANLSGRPSPTNATHVYADLSGRIPCIVDGGATSFGVESTVVDLESSVTGGPLILRPGGVTLEQLRRLIPSMEAYEEVTHGSKLKEKPPTPGLKYTHYSPNATVVLVEPKPTQPTGTHQIYFDATHLTSNLITLDDGEIGKEAGFDVDSMRDRVIEVVQNARKKGERVAIVHTHSNRLRYPDTLLSESSYIKSQHTNSDDVVSSDVVIYELGGSEEGDEAVRGEIVAKGIFQALRDLERVRVNTIVVEGVLDRHIGRAVMNRLRKAASLVV